MVDIKKIYTEVFKAIKNDAQLLGLMEIEYLGTESDSEIIGKVRKQVLDTTQPDDMLTNYAPRICIYEETATRAFSEETGFIKLDILVTQDKNKVDRKILKIATRLVEILDTEELSKMGFSKLPIGLYGLNIRRRMPKENTFSTGWDKYSLVFEYKYIV